MDELRRTLEKEKDIKCQEADRELNNVKLESESRRDELELRQRKVEAVLEEVLSTPMMMKYWSDMVQYFSLSLLHSIGGCYNFENKLGERILRG